MQFAEHAAIHFLSQAAALAWVFPVLIIVETLWPRERPSLHSRLQGAVFALIGLVASAMTYALVISLRDALHIRPLFSVSVGPMPPIALLGLAALWTVTGAIIADFFYYWTHRMQHALLWRLHSVHHAIEDLNAVNSYHHWTEDLTRLPLMTIPLAILLPDGLPTAPVVYLLLVLQSYYLHSPSTLHFGPLVRVFADNRTHRIHHSKEARHVGKNFGVLTTIWDQAFGTAYFPKPDEWPQTGLADRRETSGLVGYLLARPGPLLLDQDLDKRARSERA
jgi:sterol desaturase/sphingolipid hydroxylase (fatty acid hydroxylase superfamily)